MDALYVAEALSTGPGRNGHVRTSDGRIDTAMASPVELGGSGDGLNPELFFAAGYAACYHNALQRVAREQGVAIADTAVGAKVGLDRRPEGGFTLQVELEVVIPDLDPVTAQRLADDAHQVCPYSNATRGNIPVTIRVVED